MALRKRVWSAGKLLVLVGALVATYVLFAAASMRLALRAREVKVPDFTNRTANEATAMASGLGLAVHVDETRRIDPKIPAGNVLGQDPSAGTTAAAQHAGHARGAPRQSRRTIGHVRDARSHRREWRTRCRHSAGTRLPSRGRG